MAAGDFKKILLVDGSIAELERISAPLEGAGFIVFRATSATLALNVLDCNPGFNLVITEMALPDFPGKELIKRMRILPPYQQVPSIIVSNKVKLHEIDELLELGASYFLPKPLRIEDLFEYISKLLSNFRSGLSS